MTRTALVWAAPAGGKGCDGVTDTAVSATPSPLLVIPTDSLATELHQHVEENFHPNLTLVPPAPPPVTRSGFVGTNKKYPSPPPSSIVDRGWASAATYPSSRLHAKPRYRMNPRNKGKSSQVRSAMEKRGIREGKRRKNSARSGRGSPRMGKPSRGALRCGRCGLIRLQPSKGRISNHLPTGLSNGVLT